MATLSSLMEPFVRQNTIVLTTFRRDGKPVDTPVHIVIEDGRAFIRTYASAFKAKRIRHNPAVEVWVASNGASSALGALMRPKSARRTSVGIRARARILSGNDAKVAARALAHKYPFLHGFLIPFTHRYWYRTQTVNIELLPTGNAAPGASPIRDEPTQ